MWLDALTNYISALGFGSGDEALYERYSSEVRKSPIARSDFEAEVSVGLLYVF